MSCCFDSTGEYLLSGVAEGVTLNGKRITLHAGGWGFIADASMPSGIVVAGPGGFDTTPNGIFQGYNLRDQQLVTFTKDWRATSFFGRPGIWLAYLQDGKTYSWDYLGRTFPGKVALGLSPAGEYIFGDDSGQTIYIRRAYGGGFAPPVSALQEWVQLPSGWYFSPSPYNYAGCYAGDVWYAAAYRADRAATCLWRPFVPNSPIWRLSTDLNYNPGMAIRTHDGMLVIGSGADPSELSQNLYEVNLVSQLFRKNGGPWQPLHT